MLRTITILAAALLLAGCGCVTTVSVPTGIGTVTLQCTGNDSADVLAQAQALAAQLQAAQLRAVPPDTETASGE